MIKKAIRKCHELVNGKEVVDPTPSIINTGLRKRESIQDQIRRMIRTEASMYAMENGQESFEEADDFDIADDPIDYTSPYEMSFDPEMEQPSTQFVEEVPVSSTTEVPPSDEKQPAE